MKKEIITSSIFYVIGNGFDRHYGLDTTYSHFKNFLIDNGNWEIVDKVDKLFYERGDFSPEMIENWSDFENMLTSFNLIYADELYEEAMENAETDDDRADYWDSPAWNVNYYNEYITILKKQFDIWVKGLNTQIKRDEYFIPKPGDYFLTFNYTTTLEDNFDICHSAITHIHGTEGQEIILGHNEYVKPDTLVIVEDEASDYRDISTREAINDMLNTASKQYFKNSRQSLKRYQRVFHSIPKYNKVVIMGLSCGKQDLIYVQEIIKLSQKIDFYYYDNTSKKNFEMCVGDRNIEVNFIKW